MIAALHRRGERYLRLKFGLPAYKGESDAEHLAILAAVERKDIATAQSLISAHLLGTGELVYRFLTERAQAEAAAAAPRRKRGRPARTPTTIGS
jgi:DNA-binding GntR family transcriptional regulator